MAVFTRVGFLLTLNLPSGSYFGASLVPPREKGTYFGRKLFPETFRLGVNTLLKLTVKIAHNHADIATARVWIRVNFCIDTTGIYSWGQGPFAVSLAASLLRRTDPSLPPAPISDVWYFKVH